MVFLTSPNNPDGSVMREEELLAILELPVLVILDEAYIEFSEEPSRCSWVKKYDNLIVLRTFSKMAALAGVRIGYGFFPLDMIQYIWRAKQVRIWVFQQTSVLVGWLCAGMWSCSVVCSSHLTCAASIVQPYNVSAVAEVAACAALSNKEYLMDVKSKLIEERERMYKLLQVTSLPVFFTACCSSLWLF